MPNQYDWCKPNKWEKMASIYTDKQQKMNAPFVIEFTDGDVFEAYLAGVKAAMKIVRARNKRMNRKGSK
jgi:hypothetical protein